MQKSEIDKEIQDLKKSVQSDFGRNNYKNLHRRATELYNKAKAIGYLKGEYGALNILGNASFIICDYQKAQSYFLRSIEVAEKMKDLKDLAFGLNNIGIIFFRLKNFKRALEYYNKALNIKLRFNNKASISTTYNNIGLIYHNLKEYDKALEYFRRSLKIDKEINNSHAICRELSNIGLAWKFKNDLDKSLKYFKDSYEESKKISYKKGMATALSNIANHYLTAGEQDKALEKALEGEEIALKINSNNHLLHFYITIAGAFEKKNNYKKALKYFKKYTELKDSIFSEETHNRIMEMQIKHESEKNERELELYQAKTKELELLNAKKDKFFRIIHHDLLNPFTSMHSTADFLNKFYDKLDDRKRKTYLEMILSSSDRLIKLMDNLFEWVKTQSGEIEFLPEKVDLKDIISHSIELLANNISSKKLKIQKKFAKNCFAKADRNMIDAIIRNLITNAVKFSFEKGLIKIETRTLSKKVKFIVEDNGTGIEKENIDKIFDIEESFTTPGTKDEKGTGLGLILVKEFTDLNNGTISVKSEPGQGSSFILELPKYK